MSTSRQIGRTCAWLVGLHVVTLFVVGYRTDLTMGFPLDDAWIHQVIARTFATTGQLGYAPDRFMSAATSPLWAVVQAANYATVAVTPALFCIAINGVCIIASSLLLYGLLHRDRVPHAAIITALVAVSGNYVWFAFSGMEASLFVLLSLGTIWLWAEPGHRPRVTAICTGGSLALLFLTRPEAAALLGLLALTMPLVGRRWRDLVLAALPLLVTVIAFSIMVYLETGRASPTTLEGRRWLWFEMFPTASRLELASDCLVMWSNRLARFTFGAGELAFWVVLGLACFGATCWLRRATPRAGLVAAWTVGHLAIYLVMLPTTGHGGRYQPFVAMMFLPLAFVGINELVRACVPRHLARFVLIAGGATLAAPATLRLVAWADAHARAVDHIARTELATGDYIAKLPADAVVASFDIGGIGWRSQRELIDLGGLVDARMVGVVQSGKLFEYLEQHGVTHVVIPVGYDPAFPDPWNFVHRLGLAGEVDVRLQLVFAVHSPVEVWEPGLEATLHGAPAQHVYTLRRSTP